MESIRHIEKAKDWLRILAGIFLLSLISDVYFALRGDDGGWSYQIGLEFKQGDTFIENKKDGADSGIWISGLQSQLMDRGEPHWVRNAILLFCFVMAFRHLSKACLTPEQPKISDAPVSSIP